MEKIVSLANVELFILFLPFLSFMLYDFTQSGMIFQKYGNWLKKINPFLGKPLGLCLKCFHVWIVIIFSLIIGVSFIKFIISLGISYVILVKLFYD
jgi:hypothetical protein